MVPTGILFGQISNIVIHAKMYGACHRHIAEPQILSTGTSHHRIGIDHKTIQTVRITRSRADSLFRLTLLLDPPLPQTGEKHDGKLQSLGCVTSHNFDRTTITLQPHQMFLFPCGIAHRLKQSIPQTLGTQSLGAFKVLGIFNDMQIIGELSLAIGHTQ